MKYHVVIGYKTKKGGAAVGMEIEADTEDDADDKARAKILNGHPARTWAYSRVAEL